MTFTNFLFWVTLFRHTHAGREQEYNMFLYVAYCTCLMRSYIQYVLSNLEQNEGFDEMKGFMNVNVSLCHSTFAFQEPAVCLPRKSELQQSPGFSEEYCCEGSIHGRRGPQSSFAGESQ